MYCIALFHYLDGFRGNTTAAESLVSAAMLKEVMELNQGESSTLEV
jgi:hypothetical protein